MIETIADLAGWVTVGLLLTAGIVLVLLALYAWHLLRKEPED